MRYLPLFHDLQDAPVLVVGGGTIALRKAELLHQAGAQLQVVAPTIDPLLEALAARVNRRGFVADDVAGARLVIAAAAQPAINEAVSVAARAAGVPVNVVDAPTLCTVLFPSIIDREEVVVALSSGGRSPVLLQRLREQIEALLPQRLGALAAFLGRFRPLIQQQVGDLESRRRFWEQFLDSPGAEQVLRGDEAAAERSLGAQLEQVDQAPSAAASGEVYLVGAGPGDPDLLTLRALRLMQRADLVLYDSLVSAEILARTRRDAERIHVGKRRAAHAVPQGGINAMLVEQALKGRRVLRLKGGDPFIFGRGGEEIEQLAGHGIPFQVVPGITAANGCAALAGIPLTHRDLARSVRFVTGHRQQGFLGPDWAAGMHQADETVVVYMGLDSLGEVCRALTAVGRDPATPAALVERGTLPDQRVIVGTLRDLPDLGAAARVGDPALIIVGQVVGLYDGQRGMFTSGSGPGPGPGSGPGH